MQFCLLYAPLLTKTMVHVYSLLFDIYFRCIPVPAAATCIYAFSNFNTLFFQTKFQSLMYQNVLAAQYRNSLANELMMYHMKVTRQIAVSYQYCSTKQSTLQYLFFYNTPSGVFFFFFSLLFQPFYFGLLQLLLTCGNPDCIILVASSLTLFFRLAGCSY